MSDSGPTWLGGTRRHFRVCGSTSDEAALWARGEAGARAPHGAIVTADAQTHGRGRLGRVWASPPAGNLYLSLVLRPQVALSEVPAITLAAGIAVAETVNSFGANASLKWPNDVLCQTQDGLAKVAGVLTEMSSHGGVIEQVIVGIGMNVADHPSRNALRATSLAAVVGARATPPSVTETQSRLLGRLEVWFDAFMTGGIAALRPTYEAMLDKVSALAIESGGNRIVGHAIGITRHGALQLLDESGVIHEISAGEVSMVESESR